MESPLQLDMWTVDASHEKKMCVFLVGGLMLTIGSGVVPWPYGFFILTILLLYTFAFWLHTKSAFQSNPWSRTDSSIVVACLIVLDILSLMLCFRGKIVNIFQA
jgi:hypothetical protein